MGDRQPISGNILIIEDDPTTQKLLSTILESAGYSKVYLADSGAQALDICETKEVDVILLDLMLPDMSGTEVFARLHPSCASVPVIVITASNSVVNSVKMMKLGAFDYITKPIVDHMLLTLIEEAISYRRLRQPAAEDLPEAKKDNIFIIGSQPQPARALQQNLAESYELLAFDNLKSLKAARPIPDALAIIVDLDNRESLADLPALKYFSASSEILVITPSDNKALIHEALRRGATGFLHRPLDKTVVFQRLEQIRNMYYSDRPYNHPYYAEFTQLQTIVLKSLPEDRCHTIMIASPEPGDGRTFIAANLARNIARNSDKSILLLDFDRRDPALHKQFALHRNRGVTEIIASVASLADSIYSSEYPNLHIMPAGLHRIELNHLLTRHNVSRLLEELQQKYAIIIIDTSPLLAVNKENIDPLTIADMVDAVYLVVAPRKTRKHILQKSIEHFRANGGTITGVIINNLQVTQRENFATRLNRYRAGLIKRGITRRLFLRGASV